MDAVYLPPFYSPASSPTPSPQTHTLRHRLQRLRQPTLFLLGHCLQFSSGRRQTTPHSIPPLTQPAPNHSQPQHETANTQRQLPRASRAHIRAGPSFADLIIRGFINISAGRGEWKGNGGAHNRVFVSTVPACARPTNGPGWDCAGSRTGLIFLVAHNDN